MSPPAVLTRSNGVVSVIDHAGDDDVLQLGSDFGDYAFQKIVRQRPRRGRSGQPSVDAGRLEYPDQNRERAFATDLAQVDDLLIVDFADDDPRQLHFDEHGGFFPAEFGVLLATDDGLNRSSVRVVMRKTRVYPRAGVGTSCSPTRISLTKTSNTQISSFTRAGGNPSFWDFCLLVSRHASGMA